MFFKGPVFRAVFKFRTICVRRYYCLWGGSVMVLAWMVVTESVCWTPPLPATGSCCILYMRAWRLCVDAFVRALYGDWYGWLAGWPGLCTQNRHCGCDCAVDYWSSLVCVGVSVCVCHVCPCVIVHVHVRGIGPRSTDNIAPVCIWLNIVTAVLLLLLLLLLHRRVGTSTTLHVTTSITLPCEEDCHADTRTTRAKIFLDDSIPRSNAHMHRTTSVQNSGTGVRRRCHRHTRAHLKPRDRQRPKPTN